MAKKKASREKIEYDRLHTRKEDEVPQYLEKLVTEMTVEKGKRVYAADVVRDLIRTKLSELVSKRVSREIKQRQLEANPNLEERICAILEKRDKRPITALEARKRVLGEWIINNEGDQ